MIERSGLAWELPESYSDEILPCLDCAHWSIEIWVEGGVAFLREMHDETCPGLAAAEQRLLAADDDRCHPPPDEPGS